LFKFATTKKYDRNGKECPYVDGDEKKEENWDNFNFETEFIDEDLYGSFNNGSIDVKHIFPYIERVIKENPQYDKVVLDLDLNEDGDIGHPYIEGVRKETPQETEDRIKREEETEALKTQAKIQKEKDKEEKKRLKELAMLEDLKKKYNK